MKRRDIERSEAEMVVVNAISLGRLRAVVISIAEIVHALLEARGFASRALR